MTMWRMRMSCRIQTTINTNSQDVILIDFPLQHWLQDRTSMLRNTYIACLLSFFFPGLRQISGVALELAT